MRTFIGVILLATPVCCFADHSNTHFDVPGTPDLHVTCGNIPVEVVGGGRGGVTVDVETHDTPIGPSGVHVDSKTSGNRLDLHVVAPGQHWTWHGKEVIVKITVPRIAHVSVHADNAPVKVRGISGFARVETGNGPVEVQGLDGSANVQTGNGPVHLEGKLFGLELRMQNGPLTLRAEPGSRLDTDWHVQANNGPVSIRVPRDLRADLSIHSGNGPHMFDLPVEKSGDRHDMHAKLNGGGPEFSIHTQNGPFHIGQD